MKKITALLLSLTMVFAFTACGSSTSSSEGSDSTDSGSGETAETQEKSTAEGSESDNILIVYYSATGNTEEAANYIADITGGDTFELEPVDAYTDEDLDWTEDGSRVNQEHEDESLRDIDLVADTVENWDDYDTVFIGYPIWWGIVAWPVDGFIEANDFTGKTVIPFCTSSSSGIGESGELLTELAGTGDWQEGQRFSSGVSEADVQEWIDGLDL